MTKDNHGNMILTLLQILIILYSLPILLWSLIALPGINFYGDPIPFWSGTGLGLIFLIIGLTMVGSQIWIFIYRRKKSLPKFLEYIIAFVALGPPTFTLTARLVSLFF